MHNAGSGDIYKQASKRKKNLKSNLTNQINSLEPCKSNQWRRKSMRWIVFFFSSWRTNFDTLVKILFTSIANLSHVVVSAEPRDMQINKEADTCGWDMWHILSLWKKEWISQLTEQMMNWTSRTIQKVTQRRIYQNKMNWNMKKHNCHIKDFSSLGSKIILSFLHESIR